MDVDPTPTRDRPPPRCPRCGAPLVPAPAPRSAFGLGGDACVDCGDPPLSGSEPWACPACGTVVVLPQP